MTYELIEMVGFQLRPVSYEFTTKRHWKRVFITYVGFPFSVSLHKRKPPMRANHLLQTFLLFSV